MTSAIAKKSTKKITKYFLIVSKNESLLAAIYVGDDLTANLAVSNAAAVVIGRSPSREYLI